MPTAETQRLLKANDIRGLGSKIVFNFEDLRHRCDDYIEKIRQQSQQMIKDAHTEAEKIRQTAFDEAKTEGRREGLKNARAEIDRQARELAEQCAAEKLRTMIPAMQEAAAKLVGEHDRWLAEWESAAIRLSVSIAERILRRQLDLSPQIATEMISSALQLAAGSPHVKLRMHPQDLELLGDQADAFVRSIAACGDAEIIPDKTISPGGCVIQTDHGIVDSQLETQLERITSELIERS